MSTKNGNNNYASIDEERRKFDLDMKDIEKRISDKV
jgi:hypothetical protein